MIETWFREKNGSGDHHVEKTQTEMYEEQLKLFINGI
jgi:hypothetical protein